MLCQVEECGGEEEQELLRVCCPITVVVGRVPARWLGGRAAPTAALRMVQASDRYAVQGWLQLTGQKGRPLRQQKKGCKHSLNTTGDL